MAEQLPLEPEVGQHLFIAVVAVRVTDVVASYYLTQPKFSIRTYLIELEE